MPWETQITDWDGVTEVPNRKWYNFADLNRVEGNTDAVADLIATYATKPTLFGLLTTRDMTAIEFFDSLDRVEGNILVLRNASYQPPGWITPVTNWASRDPFDYTDANRLESNLQALHSLINNIKSSFKYSGTFSSGQDIVL